LSTVRFWAPRIGLVILLLLVFHFLNH